MKEEKPKKYIRDSPLLPFSRDEKYKNELQQKTRTTLYWKSLYILPNYAALESDAVL